MVDTCAKWYANQVKDVEAMLRKWIFPTNFPFDLDLWSYTYWHCEHLCHVFFFVRFFTSQSSIFHSWRDGYSWVEPVLNSGLCSDQGHNTVTRDANPNCRSSGIWKTFFRNLGTFSGKPNISPIKCFNVTKCTYTRQESISPSMVPSSSLPQA